MRKRRRKRRKRRTQSPSPLKGLMPGVRMKGGVRFDPALDGYVAIVHTWDNVQCHGEPEEWRSPETSPTEDAAMQHYKTAIRPALEQMMADVASGQSDSTLIHRKLEE